MNFNFSLPQRHQRRFSWLVRGLLVLFTCLILIALNGLQPSQAQSNSNSVQEKILSYQSEIQVKKDASLRVAETITVQAAGEEIKRGIYRDFPLDSPFQSGRVPFEVIDVLRNGESTAYQVEDRGDEKRILIYRENVTLDPGTYTYTIQYTTDRQLDFSNPETDRLYWNVTGQGWSFAIDRVRAKVLLPDEIPETYLELKAFTGREGETGQDYEAEIDAGGNPTFRTTRPLQKQEGLSIIVEFPQGYVERPSFWETAYYSIAGFFVSLFKFLKISIILMLPYLIFLGIIALIIFSMISSPTPGSRSNRRSGGRGGGFGGGGGGAGGGGGGGGGGGL